MEIGVALIAEQPVGDAGDNARLAVERTLDNVQDFLVRTTHERWPAVPPDLPLPEAQLREDTIISGYKQPGSLEWALRLPPIAVPWRNQDHD